MNTSRIWKSSILILIGLVFTGCASTGSIHMITPVNAKLADYKTVLLCVTSQTPESSGETIQLGSMITDKLHDKGLFEKVLIASGCSGCRADLRLNAKILEAKEVGSRVVNVALTDMNTGASIGSFEAEGKSSSGGTTSQAIERAAEQIVGFLGKNM